MNTYSPTTFAYACKCHDITPNGVLFDWWLANINGAGFALLREPEHTDDDIDTAKAFLRRERDVVTLRVLTPDGTKPTPWLWPSHRDNADLDAAWDHFQHYRSSPPTLLGYP